PTDGYDTATAADDVAAAARALGISGAVVAGQSWGGNVVVQVAARHPGVVAALALVDGGFSDMSTAFPSWEACEKALRPPDIDGSPVETILGYFRDAHPDWSQSAIDATLANLAVAPDGTVSRRLSIPHHMRIVRSMWDDPPQRYYPDVHVPVLLMPAIGSIGSVEDRRERVRAAAAAFADATIHEFVGADHDIHAQHPGDVAADLLALADKVDLAGRVG
ncbi:MAG TPA: alpha/beta hydrolase, partial [Micromonosporaceae bacterium]